MSIIMYVGIDVHMETFSICSYKTSEDKFYYEKTVKAESKNVIKYLDTIKNEIYKQTAEEVTEKKEGVYWESEQYIENIYDGIWYDYAELSESRTVSGTETSCSWYIEDGKLFMIQDESAMGTSYNVYIFGDELILESENAETFIRFKRK